MGDCIKGLHWRKDLKRGLALTAAAALGRLRAPALGEGPEPWPLTLYAPYVAIAHMRIMSREMAIAMHISGKKKVKGGRLDTIRPATEDTEFLFQVILFINQLQVKALCCLNHQS